MMRRAMMRRAMQLRRRVPLPRPPGGRPTCCKRSVSTAGGGGGGGSRPWRPSPPPSAPPPVALRPLLGLSSWSRIRTRAQLWLYKRLVDPAFDRDETEEGVRVAYSTVAALAFGPASTRDAHRLRQLCTTEVTAKLHAQAEAFGERSLTVYEVVHAEIMNVTKDRGPSGGASRVGIDVRFLSYESVRDEAGARSDTADAQRKAAVLKDRGVGTYDQHDRLEEMLDSQIAMLRTHLADAAEAAAAATAAAAEESEEGAAGPAIESIQPPGLRERLNSALAKLEAERAALPPSPSASESRWLVTSTWRFEGDLLMPPEGAERARSRDGDGGSDGADDPAQDRWAVEWEVTQLERHRVAQARPAAAAAASGERERGGQGASKSSWESDIKVPWPFAGEW